MKNIKIAFISFTIAMCAVSCAYVNSNTATYGTNGQIVATTHARAVTLFDSQANISKFRNSTGGPTNTFTQGTTVSGFNESSSASNLVLILQTAAALAAKAP